jgi:hypothetical protein
LQKGGGHGGLPNWVRRSCWRVVDPDKDFHLAGSMRLRAHPLTASAARNGNVPDTLRRFFWRAGVDFPTLRFQG